jgi:hypothetical protein
MALGAQPQHFSSTSERLLKSADDLWWLAGDTSTDIHWYSRRLLLVSVIVASELHFLTDTSPACADTFAFIERRVADVSIFGRGAGEALSVGQASAAGVGSILTAGLGLLQPLPAFILQQLLSRPGAASVSSQPKVIEAEVEASPLDRPIATETITVTALARKGPGAAFSAALRATAPVLVPGTGGPIDTLAKSLLPASMASTGEAVVRGLFGDGVVQR